MPKPVTLNPTALNILGGIVDVDHRDAVADLVYRAEDLLTQEYYRLMGDSMPEDYKRKLRGAIAAQWSQ